MSGNNDPFSANIDHVASYISEASMDWVQVINAAQNSTAEINNVISKKLMALYDAENKALNSIIKALDDGVKKWTTKSISYQIQKLGMEMQVTQKKWDNAINQVQTTAQQQTSQMSAQGNDSNQATTAAGLMAQLMQIIVSLLQSSL
jgi:phenylalanyl-tRNA synthetase alpha subunit